MWIEAVEIRLSDRLGGTRASEILRVGVGEAGERRRSSGASCTHGIDTDASS
jgi:hypothetical protein